MKQDKAFIFLVSGASYENFFEASYETVVRKQLGGPTDQKDKAKVLNHHYPIFVLYIMFCLL